MQRRRWRVAEHLGLEAKGAQDAAEPLSGAKTIGFSGGSDDGWPQGREVGQAANATRVQDWWTVGYHGGEGSSR